jgi:hypothetical protein
MVSSSWRSSAIWCSNNSRWVFTETYSPVAMDRLPASNPENPAMTRRAGRAGRGHADQLALDTSRH